MKKMLILAAGLCIACGVPAWAKGKPEIKAPEAPKISADALKLPTGALGQAGAETPAQERLA